jgi:hypothetical protein
LRAARGDPGPSGPGGMEGGPGTGGREGEVQLPYCRPSGRQGQDGKPGHENRDTVRPSPSGADGRYVVVELSERQLTAIFQ